jgi:hypothetical protein
LGLFLESAIWCDYQGGMRREAFRNLAVALFACAQPGFVSAVLAGPHDALIAKHAAANGVPEELVRRVVRVESRGNAAAAHRGNYGLMQIRLATARGVGYSGEAEGLLDPDTNLTYAVKYLAGAYRAAGCDADRALSYYQRGYYGAARRECGAASPAAMQLAQAETKTKAKVKRVGASATGALDAAETKPPDVIKPKVVRTETIVTPKSGSAPARPVGSFEPVRILPPPAQPAALSAPTPNQASKPDLPRPDPIKPDLIKPDLTKPASTELVGKFELASVPLPPVRPELDAAASQKVQPIRLSGRAPERASKKSKADAKPKVGAKSKAQSKRAASKSNSKSKTESSSKPDSIFKLEDPAGVVSFLKKLVTPDKSRKPAEAQADPPSPLR